MTDMHIQNKEDGFASIVIALVLITVLSLITLGFAQLARHEQQNALNKQLAIQANYAAESGINDAEALIRHGKITSGNGTSCLNLSSYTDNTVVPARTYSNTINGLSGVTYSCVLVKTDLPKLVKDPLPAGTSWTAIFHTDPTKPKLESIDVAWASTKPAGKVLSTLPVGVNPNTGWNSPAVLEVSIVPLTSNFGTPNSRSSLISGTFTVYLYPKSPANTIAYAPGAVRIAQGCATVTTCSVTINNLASSGVPAGGSYMVRILAFYDESIVSIEDGTSVGPITKLDFTGAQALVDVTGRARDVLKRLQVRIPLNGGADPDSYPNYSLEAQDICKRMETQPAGTRYVKTDGTDATSAADPCYLN